MSAADCEFAAINEQEVYGAIGRLKGGYWNNNVNRQIVNAYTEAFKTMGVPAWPITPARFAFWFVKEPARGPITRGKAEQAAMVLGNLRMSLSYLFGDGEAGGEGGQRFLAHPLVASVIAADRARC